MAAMDHFFPIALGGGTTVDNCIPICSSCNGDKSRYNPNVYGELLYASNDYIGIKTVEGIRAYLDSKK